MTDAAGCVPSAVTLRRTVHYLRKYPNLDVARARPDAELVIDADRVANAIAVHPDPAEGYRLTVVRDWIAQARLLRLWGLDSSR